MIQMFSRSFSQALCQLVILVTMNHCTTAHQRRHTSHNCATTRAMVQWRKLPDRIWWGQFKSISQVNPVQTHQPKMKRWNWWIIKTIFRVGQLPWKPEWLPISEPEMPHVQVGWHVFNHECQENNSPHTYRPRKNNMISGDGKLIHWSVAHHIIVYWTEEIIMLNLNSHNLQDCRYVVGKSFTVVGMWSVDNLPTTYRQFNLFHITV